MNYSGCQARKESPVIITDHAVERFCERIQPGTSFATARARIEAYLSDAVKLREKTRSKEDLYQIEALRCRLVVRPSRWAEDEPVLVTVLPLDAFEEVEAAPLEEEPPSPASASFDPEAVALRIDAAKEDAARRAIVAELSHEQVLELKRWAAVQVPEANAAKERSRAMMLNKVGAYCNAVLSSPDAGRALRHFFRRSAADEEDLLRVLGAMLKKYGAAHNPDAAEVYERVRAAVKGPGRTNVQG